MSLGFVLDECDGKRFEFLIDSKIKEMLRLPVTLNLWGIDPGVSRSPSLTCCLFIQLPAIKLDSNILRRAVSN